VTSIHWNFALREPAQCRGGLEELTLRELARLRILTEQRLQLEHWLRERAAQKLLARGANRKDADEYVCGRNVPMSSSNRLSQMVFEKVHVNKPVPSPLVSFIRDNGMYVVKAGEEKTHYAELCGTEAYQANWREALAFMTEM
jgi:hypothetical protein